MMIAHIRYDDRTVLQSVGEHCRAVAELGGRYASVIGAEAIGHLQGLLHDAGKLTVAFQRYILSESDARRGEIDHSYAGARYVHELA